MTLEKLGQRDQAIKLLTNLKQSFGNEVRLHNNLGIIQKRKGDVKSAIDSYTTALKADPDSFFPNYNVAVVLASESKFADALGYFEKAKHLSQLKEY